MAKLSYAETLKDQRWEDKRMHILRRDNNCCKLCGSYENLHVHHILYEEDTDPWDYDENYLITVCEFCHNRIHSQLQQNSHLKERLRTISDDLVYRTMRYLTNSYPKFIYDFNQLNDASKSYIMNEMVRMISEILSYKKTSDRF